MTITNQQLRPDGSFEIEPARNETGKAQNDPTIAFTISCSSYSIQFPPPLSASTVTGGETCSDSTSYTTVGATCDATSQTSFSGGRTSAPFGMSVQDNITPSTSNVTALLQPPTQLIGSVASVYVFAHAPQSALASAKRVAQNAPGRPTDGSTPDPCVLAQLNGSGQLVAASASNLHATTSGVIGAENQSVTILNNVATPSVAGASFYVGYGPTSSEMLSSGLYEGAVSVSGQFSARPNSPSCSAALLDAAAPKSPGALSGLWWNSSESGWGISFSQRRNILFGAWFTYDASGKPKWYVAPKCEMPSGSSGTSGTCSGSLYEVSGAPFLGASFDASRVQASTAGTLKVTFQDVNNASMSYSLNGQARTVAITRQLPRNEATPPAVDYTDLWWNANESGWGMAITQQYGVMFLAWFVYDGSAKPMWYVANECVVAGSDCSGALYRTTGPVFGPTFNASAVHATPVGTVAIRFIDANNGVLNYTVDGTSSTKNITRQLY